MAEHSRGLAFGRGMAEPGIRLKKLADKNQDVRARAWAADDVSELVIGLTESRSKM